MALRVHKLQWILVITGALVDFGKLFNAFDGIVTLVDSIKGPSKQERSREGELTETPRVGLAGQFEAGLTNVVLAALKEAFDRDHARLEMERAHLEEQRLRAEASMRMEMRRQAADREAGRLKLLAVTALIGWIVSMVLLVPRIGHITVVSQLAVAVGCLLLLAALGCAFAAHGRISGPATNDSQTPESNAGAATMWLLLAGLALTGVSLLM
jgi:hypothetical protein